MYLKPWEAAEYLSSTKGTLAQMRHKKQGPCWYALGRAIRYRKEDLNAYMGQRVCVPNNAPGMQEQGAE